MPGRTPIGRVYGRVVDEATRKPAEYATVAVHSMRRDSLLGGTITRANGDFSVDNLPFGPLKVRVTFIGFTTLERTVTLSPTQVEVDLGNLALEADAELLKEVEITGERPTVLMQVDRRVFNVEKDLSTQGGSGVEVMKNIPGLSVDVEGNVEMRGARPQVLVDGRPTSLQLDQIPAEDIERVEVITNPSVAFDANATGGIINVVLKKNTRPGYFGQVQAGIGNNGRYQGSANINVRDGRWNWNLGLNYNTSGNLTDGRTLRADLSAGDTLGWFRQEARNDQRTSMYGGRMGVEWQQSNRNTLGISFNMRARGHDGTETQEFRTTGPGEEVLRTGTQINTSAMNNLSYSGQLSFRRKSPKVGKEWNADLTYNGWSRDSRSSFASESFEANGSATSGTPRTQRNVGGSTYGQVTLQADAVDPINERTKLEYGLKSNVRLDNTWLDVYQITPNGLGPIRDAALSNDYDITDIINAVYGNWSRKLNERWSLMAGLRIEQTWFETLLKETGERFSYKYPDGTSDLERALFPALYVVRRWGEGTREMQINFSRKIDRPRFWQIMPFIMFADARNVRIGNPTLAPELSDLAEVNHLLPFLQGKASWLTSIYGRHTKDVITGYVTPLESDSTVLLNTFINGSYSLNGGWENVLKVEPSKGLSITASGTIQFTDVALAAQQGGDRNQGLNWNAKLLVSYRFLNDWAFQLNGEYESPRIQPQGRTIAQYGVDATLNHEWSKQWSANLSVSDVFFTRRWGNVVSTETLWQENFRRREQRNIRLTVTWKFGERDASLFRRRQQQRSEPGSGGDMDF